MKPGDFLIGLRDFFAVLIPGAIFTFLIASFAKTVGPLPDWWTPLAYTFDDLDHTEQTLVLAVIAYACGQVISSISSLLDKPIDLFEENYGQNTGKYFLWGIDPQARLVTYRRIATQLKDDVAGHLFQTGARDQATVSEENIAKKQFWTVKSFWKDYLRLRESVATSELDRIESVQKLFRSLAVVFLLAAGWTIFRSTWGAVGASLTAFVVCFYLYVRFRLEFMYRLYKLAVLTSVDEATVKKLAPVSFTKWKST